VLVAGEEFGQLEGAIRDMRVRCHELGKQMAAELEDLRNAKQLAISMLKAVPPSAVKVNRTNPKTPSKLVQSITVEPNTPFAQPIPGMAPVNDQEMDQVPKYLRGRLTRDRVNGAVEFLNRLLREKYTLLQQNPAKLSVEQRQRYYEWRDAEEPDELAGRAHISDADIKSALSKGSSNSFKMDPAGKSILAILRHLGRIKEVRSAMSTRYAINN